MPVLSALRQRKQRIGKFAAIMLAAGTYGTPVTLSEAVINTALAVPYAIVLSKHNNELTFRDFRENAYIWIAVMTDNAALAHKVAVLANPNLTISCLPKNKDGDPVQDEMACHAVGQRDKKGKRELTLT